MTELQDLLERSTDRIAGPDLAARALAGARRRRTARRGVVAAGTAAAVVLVIAVAGQLGGRESSTPPIAPSPTPTAAPTTTPPVQDVAPWDPRKVDDLPQAPDDLMAALPRVLDVPSSTVPLPEDPVEAAVLTIEKNDALKVLGVDGTWRRVPLPSENGSVELTRDGTRLLVGTDTGVDVWDLEQGTVSSVPLPAGHQRSDFVVWHWLDDRTLLLDGSWRIDTETGEATQGRVPEGPYVVDDAGEVYESEWGGPLTMLQVRGDTVAGVGWSDRTDSLGVTVADRADLATRLVLPVRDDGQTTYGNGGLSVQALLSDGTVLLRMLVRPADPEIRFVAWQPATGELSLVMRTSGVLPGWSVAVDLLE